jgi:hypothetical protein
MTPKIKGSIRHLLTFAGGFAVARGYIDEGTLTETVGAVVTVIGTIWSICADEKKK